MPTPGKPQPNTSEKVPGSANSRPWESQRKVMASGSGA